MSDVCGDTDSCGGTPPPIDAASRIAARSNMVPLRIINRIINLPSEIVGRPISSIIQIRQFNRSPQGFRSFDRRNHLIRAVHPIDTGARTVTKVFTYFIVIDIIGTFGQRIHVPFPPRLSHAPYQPALAIRGPALLFVTEEYALASRGGDCCKSVDVYAFSPRGVFFGAAGVVIPG